MIPITQQGDEEDESDNGDDDDESDLEPAKREDTARDVRIRSLKKKHKSPAGRRKRAVGRQAKGKGGRWGGGKAGSDPSALLLDPYAIAGDKRPWAEVETREQGGEEEGDVEVVLCGSGNTGRSGGGGGGRGRTRGAAEGQLNMCRVTVYQPFELLCYLGFFFVYASGDGSVRVEIKSVKVLFITFYLGLYVRLLLHSEIPRAWSSKGLRVTRYCYMRRRVNAFLLLSILPGGTLVVCPLSLIGQWRGELESKTRKGALSVSFYYGTTKSRCDASVAKKTDADWFACVFSPPFRCFHSIFSCLSRFPSLFA